MGIVVGEQKEMSKEDKLWWLKEAIRSYMRKHERLDPIDIISYMKVQMDITATALYELEEEGQIERYWNGGYYEVRLKK